MGGIHPLTGKNITINVVASEHEAKKEHRKPRRKRYTTPRALAHELQHESDRVNHPKRTCLESASKFAWVAGIGALEIYFEKYISLKDAIPLFFAGYFPYYRFIDPSERRARKTQNTDQVVKQLEEILVFDTSKTQSKDR